MQIKIVVASIFALAVGNAIANPVPAEEIEDSVLEARGDWNTGSDFGGLTPSGSELATIKTNALAFAQANVHTIPSSYHIQQAQNWFPYYPSTTYTNYWPLDWWVYYYCYQYYPQYNNWWNYRYPNCIPGLLC